MALADFSGRTLARDVKTGTTAEDSGLVEPGPRDYREVHGVEVFLTCVAAGQAVGITSRWPRSSSTGVPVLCTAESATPTGNGRLGLVAR
jgi:hypothetical protein